MTEKDEITKEIENIPFYLNFENIFEDLSLDDKGDLEELTLEELIQVKNYLKHLDLM